MKDAQFKHLNARLDEILKFIVHQNNQIQDLKDQNRELSKLLEYAIKLSENHRAEFRDWRTALRKNAYNAKVERARNANTKAHQKLTAELRTLVMEALYPDREPENQHFIRGVQKDFLQDKYSNHPDRRNS